MNTLKNINNKYNKKNSFTDFSMNGIHNYDLDEYEKRAMEKRMGVDKGEG